MMKKYHFTILTADNGFKGLEMIEANSDIKVVISDMKMPMMNGLEFIKRIKIKHPEICCMMISGFELSKEIKDAIDIGLIFNYLNKPFNINILVKEIN